MCLHLCAYTVSIVYREGEFDAIPKKVCAHGPVSMYVKHFKPGWCWEKVPYKCVVLLFFLSLKRYRLEVKCLWYALQLFNTLMLYIPPSHKMLYISLSHKKKIFAALMSIKEMITMAVVSRVAVPGCRPAAE